MEDVKDWSFLEEVKIKKDKLNFWFGPEATTSRLHYDASDNLYVQVYGMKKFILIDVEEVEKVYLFPFLHPGTFL